MQLLLLQELYVIAVDESLKDTTWKTLMTALQKLLDHECPSASATALENTVISNDGRFLSCVDLLSMSRI